MIVLVTKKLFQKHIYIWTSFLFFEIGSISTYELSLGTVVESLHEAHSHTSLSWKKFTKFKCTFYLFERPELLKVSQELLFRITIRITFQPDPKVKKCIWKSTWEARRLTDFHQVTSWVKIFIRGSLPFELPKEA